MSLAPLERAVLHALRVAGPLSRRELTRRLGARPNSVGDAAARLVRLGVLREGDPPTPPAARGRGRPSTPLALDPRRRHVLGLALEPGRIGCSRLNLLGQLLDPPDRLESADPGRLLRDAAELLRRHIDRRTLAIGLSTTGFVDVAARKLLMSSVLPDASAASLAPIFDAAPARCPVVLDNDMHGLAAAWLMTQPDAARDDVLLVELHDGAVGGALIIDGRPNRGCVAGGNEIGHTRTAAETPRCYCGRRGCLERVFSSRFLGTAPGRRDDLHARMRRFDPADRPLARMIDLAGSALADAVNLVRPARLVLHLPADTDDPFAAALFAAIRREMLSPLAERVVLSRWVGGPARFSESAGWLALAAFSLPRWGESA